MKVISNISLLLVVFLYASCIRERDHYSDDMEATGMISVEILENEGEAIDKVETVRFLVFKDASGSPKLELNELLLIPAVDPDEKEVSEFKVVLEVSRKLNGGDDKIVIAVVNEPPAMKNILDQVPDYNGLMNLKLNFADFLTNDHSSLQNGKTMLMTGAVRTNKVYAAAQEAQADPVGMELLRAVALVELYIRKQAGVDSDLAIGSNVILKNTYDKEYFIRNEEGSAIFGKIQTITSGFINKRWDASATTAIPDVASGSNGLLVCSFYTPERTCTAPDNADKLILDITVRNNQGESINNTTILDEMTVNQVNTKIYRIERNNVYRVIATVTDKGLLITATVVDWTEENLEVEF